MADQVELTDLETITRFSLAVRARSADRAEVIHALRTDLAWLEAGAGDRPAQAPGAQTSGAPGAGAPGAGAAGRPGRR